MRSWVTVVSIAVLTAGCASEELVTQDLSPAQSPWMTGRATSADGTKLKMRFDSEPRELRIKRIDYKVAEGELYLWPVRASERFEPVEFTLDTAKLKLKQPWTEHVYWVATSHWDGALGRLVDPDPLGDRVERVKADVK
jgi:hypothetical protein